MSRVKITESNIVEEKINLRTNEAKVFEMINEPVYYGLIEQLAYKEPTYWDQLKAIISAPDFIIKTLFAIINILTIYGKKK